MARCCWLLGPALLLAVLRPALSILSTSSGEQMLSTSLGAKFLATYILQEDVAMVNFFSPAPAELTFNPRASPNFIKYLSAQASVPVAVNLVVTTNDISDAIARRNGEGRMLNIANVETARDMQMLKLITSKEALVRNFLWLFLGDPNKLHDSDLVPYLPLDNMVIFADLSADGEEVMLYDVYQISPYGEYRVRRAGQWRPEAPRGFPSGDELSLTRTNLTGLHLRCVTLEQSPFVYLQDGAAEGQVDIYKGHAGDVWRILQDLFGFTYSCRRSEDGSWGTLRDGQWTGLVKEIQSGSADVVVGPLDHTPERQRAVDYTLGLRSTGYRLVIKRRALMDSTWTTFTHEFSKEAWGGTLALVLIAPLFLCFVTHVSPTEKDRISLRDAYIITLGALAYQGADVSLTSAAGRIVFFVIFLGTLLTYCHYTSALVASLTVASTTQPVESLMEVVNSGVYDLGFMAEISVENEFRVSTSPPFEEAWDQLIEPKLPTLPTSNEEGIERASTGKYIHIMDESIYTYEFSSNCQVMTLAPQYFSKPTGFAFAKDSPLIKLFDHQILKLRTGGILERSWNRLQPPKSPCQDVGVVTLNPTQVFTAFLILMLGAGLSVVLLPVEKLYKHSADPDNKNKNKTSLEELTSSTTPGWGVDG